MLLHLFIKKLSFNGYLLYLDLRSLDMPVVLSASLYLEAPCAMPCLNPCGVPKTPVFVEAGPPLNALVLPNWAPLLLAGRSVVGSSSYAFLGPVLVFVFGNAFELPGILSGSNPKNTNAFFTALPCDV